MEKDTNIYLTVHMPPCIKDDLEQERENIFHTKCRVNSKVYSVILDGKIHERS